VAGASSTPPPVPAAGLAEICIGQTAGETLAALAPGLARDLLRFEAEGFAAFAQRFEALDALQGRMVTLSDGSHGRADGVDASGALRVQTDAGCRVINSAQVSVRPC
jgi:BirA family biotin operon repressor/biotin-[acetyl-CoA-carboxylase] ligase